MFLVATVKLDPPSGILASPPATSCKALGNSSAIRSVNQLNDLVLKRLAGFLAGMTGIAWTLFAGGAFIAITGGDIPWSIIGWMGLAAAVLAVLFVVVDAASRRHPAPDPKLLAAGAGTGTLGKVWADAYAKDTSVPPFGELPYWIPGEYGQPASFVTSVAFQGVVSRLAIAKDPGTPSSLLAMMTDDPDLKVRGAAAVNLSSRRG